MILRALVDFSNRECLVENPLFSYSGVSWAIEIGLDGEFYQLRDLRSDSTGKGPKRKIPRQMLIPKRPIRAVNILPAFLVDKALYVLGIADQDLERARICKTSFTESMKAAAAATSDPAALAAARFLANDEAVQLAVAELQSTKFASQDLICFRYEGTYLHDSEALKEYWQSLHAPELGSTSPQCLICGKSSRIARLHTPIKRIPGASTSGVPLVSFNQSAFCSYGWEKNENAPVCENCVSAYSTALNRCLSSQFLDPQNQESLLPRQSHTLGENLTAVYWSEDPDSHVEELVDSAFRSPQMVQSLLESSYHRSTPTNRPLRFHCLLLQGAQGRATVRSYIAEPIAEIQQNLRDWLALTEVGGGRPLSLIQILSSLAVKNEINKLPSNLTGELYLAILFKRKIPYTALHLAVTRNRVLTDVSPARAALLQVWRYRDQPSNERNSFVTLDPESTSVGYQLGRLLAVCGSIQYKKSKTLNKTLVDRYFPAMSTRPAYVMGALLRLTKQIQSQISISGASPYLDSTIAEILSHVPPNPPATLELKEQANFALGFYHQRKKFMTKAPEPTEAADLEESTEEKGSE